MRLKEPDTLCSLGHKFYKVYLIIMLFFNKLAANLVWLKQNNSMLKLKSIHAFSVSIH